MKHLLLLVFFLFTFSSATHPFLPDHYIKSAQTPPDFQQNNISPEYLEVTKPLSFDLTTPCTHLHLLQHDFANTYGAPPASTLYSPPSDCPGPWTHIILEFHVSCKGEQYDRIAGVWLDGVEILRTSTAEPTESGIFWKIHKDVTRYSSLLLRSNLTLTVMLENIVNDVFTGIYHVNISLLYYGGGKQSQLAKNQIFDQKPADLIIPISNNGEGGFWFRIQNESDLGFKKIQIPRNTYKAVLEIYVSFHGNDEFWYSNPPNEYIELNNLTTPRGNGAFRQVFLTIDKVRVGGVVPCPVIFTGGINPLFWEPVVGIGAFDLPTYDLNLSPLLGLLLDGKSHLLGLGVTDSIPFWLVDANLHLWLDSSSPIVTAKSVIRPTPTLVVKRDSIFRNLDGLFEINAEGSIEFSGWVSSSLGNLTTYVSHEFKFENSIRFKNDGKSKEVEQVINAKVHVSVESDRGELLSREIIESKYPLYVLTSTLPGIENDTYLQITNVSHALNEKFSLVLPNTDFFSFTSNNQFSDGWMIVQDHSVLSGNASTLQTLLYIDDAGCYSRIVSASNGKLIEDNSTQSCISSL